MRHQQHARGRLVIPAPVRDALRDSSWVTMAWDWFQTLLSRAVEAVLWATMVFSCYQLIPGAAQPSAHLSSLAFILQFVALDVGGLGLNTLARQQGLARWSYARLVAYTLIGITLVTMSVAGLERTGALDPQAKAWIEITLVMARSIMTVTTEAIEFVKPCGKRTENPRETPMTSLQRHSIPLASGQCLGACFSRLGAGGLPSRCASRAASASRGQRLCQAHTSPQSG